VVECNTAQTLTNSGTGLHGGCRIISLSGVNIYRFVGAIVFATSKSTGRGSSFAKSQERKSADAGKVAWLGGQRLSPRGAAVVPVYKNYR
jgi:hypothetical protein